MKEPKIVVSSEDFEHFLRKQTFFQRAREDYDTDLGWPSFKLSIDGRAVTTAEVYPFVNYAALVGAFEDDSESNGIWFVLVKYDSTWRVDSRVTRLSNQESVRSRTPRERFDLFLDVATNR